MPEQPGAGPLDPETLAAYIDGLLPPEERARVDAEIAADPETYEWVVNSIGAVDDPTVATPVESERRPAPAPGPRSEPGLGPAPRNGNGVERKVLPFYRRRGVQGLLGTLMAAAAALMMVVRTQPVWWQEVWGPSVDPRFAKLVEAVGEERYIEARLTGGFKYGPLRQVMRGPGDLSNQNLQLLAAAGELQKAAEKEPTSENLHAWGIGLLLIGDFDAALATLENAAALSPQPRASLASDLSGAYAARAKAGRLASDWVKSLAWAETSLRREPTLTEALYNRALAVESLGLDPTRAWGEYLERDASSDWAHEVRARIRLPAGASVQEPKPHVRVLVDEAFGKWARHVVEGRHGLAAGDLELARRLAIESAAKGDMLPSSLVAYISENDSAPASVNSRRVAMTILDYLEAWRTLQAEGPQAAAPTMNRAAAEFRRMGLAYSLWGPIFSSIAARFVGRVDAPLQAIGQYSAPEKSHAYLRGRFLWTRGVAHQFAGNVVMAQSDLRDALDTFDTFQDLGSAASVLPAMAEVSMNLGDSEEAWKSVSRAIDISTRSGISPWRALLLGAKLGSETGLPDVAFHFQRQAVDELVRQHDSVNLPDAFRNLADVNHWRGDRSAASAAARTARGLIRDVPGSGQRQKAEAELDLVEGRIRQEAEPQEASRLLESALTYFRTVGLVGRVPEIGIQLGRAYRQLGKHDLARRALAAAVESHAAELRVVSQLPLTARFSALAPSRVAAVELAVFDATAGRADSALASLETARAQQLVESHLGHVPRPPASADLAAGLDSHAVLYFAQSDNDLYAWVVRGGSVSFFKVPAEAQTVAREVARLRTRVESGATLPDVLASARLLHTWLVAPAKIDWRAAKSLLIVPDGVLWGTPFALLVDDDDVPLVSRTTIVLSASIYAFHESSRQLDSHGVESVLAIGSGATTSSQGVSALPGAAREIEAVAERYPVARLLTGAAALPDGLLKATEDVVHFAGHSIYDEQEPLASSLLFASGDQRYPGGRLTAGQIATYRLRGPLLIVLSSCEAARGPGVPSRGSLSLSVLLFAAGIPNVLSAVWRVDDRASGVVLGFHRWFRRLRDPGAALALAQREQLVRHPDGPVRDWAGYVALGGMSREARSSKLRMSSN